MKQISMVKTVLKLALISVVGLLVACASSSDSAPPADASISGIITAAPVSEADVSVVDVNGNVVAGPVRTDVNGKYTNLVIPNGSLGQDLIIKSTGGTFTDEATGNTDVTAGSMLSYVPASSLSNGSSVSATPGSTIIANLIMNHNKTMTQAQESFQNAFGYTPDISITPADATTAPAADETVASTLAGFRAAAFSQLASDLGLPQPQDDQFEMFAALAQDLSDEKLDGVDASGVVDIGTTGSTLEANIQNRFATALINFHDSVYNKTDLDNAQIGNLPFGKIAFTTDDVNDTSTYQIEYKQIGMMGPMEGKSTFQIHVTDRNTGDGVTGLAPMLMPMMHMSTMTHSSPMSVDAVSEDGNGLYTVTLYYLMASQMMDGASMGYWDLTFTVNGEKAHFYPAVMMAMGDTVLAKLKGVVDLDSATDVNLDGVIDIADLDGVADIILNMDGSFASRTYFIFKDSLEGTGPSYTFTMFIAAKEDMKSFPALVTPDTLTSGMGGTPLDITSIGVNVSVNGGGPVPAADNGDGTWDITLPLNNGVANQVVVELSVNGEPKTIDGKVPGLLVDSNDDPILDSNGDPISNTYSFFTVTP